jgi:multiple sugar transport system substrate-binding protein
MANDLNQIPLTGSKPDLTRRCLLSGVLAAGAISATGGTMFSSALAQTAKTLDWWDQFAPLAPLHQKIWDEFTASNSGVKIVYTQMNPSDMMQGLQLAFRSKRAPDIHSIIASDLSVTNQLVKAGWFTPLGADFKTDSPFLKEALFEGVTIFNSKLYSFPTFSFRQHETSLWWTRASMELAGVDPAIGPRTWDEMRKAAQAMTKGRTYGLILPLQFTNRIANHVQDLAQVAGSPGRFDWRTGAYAYGSAPFVEAVEFLLSFQRDGSLHPASSSLDARQGRARWAAGEAGMFFDGSWNSGVVKGSFAQVLDALGAGSIPVPSLDRPAFTYHAPPSGVFWISSQCEDPETASKVLQRFTSDAYYVGLAEQMDQPPLDLSAVDRAVVHPSYKAVIDGFKKTVRLAPEPLIKNPNVAQVYAEMRPVTPGIGEILQGAMSGAVTNVKAVLQQHADKLTAERDRALKVVKGRGVEVSLEDWVFPNWQPGEDYIAERYKA